MSETQESEEQKQAPQEQIVEEEVGEEEEQKLKLPFPTAAVVRIMKANMDGEKMIKKEVKIAMNKWLGEICGSVARNMNKFPYVMMHMHEFESASRFYKNLKEFDREKERILAHLDAIRKDIERLERDLGKPEEMAKFTPDGK